MSLDLKTFNPSTAADLAKGILGDISQMGAAWWKANAPAVEGYVKSLAEAATETAQSLAKGEMPKAEAAEILTMQKEAFATSIKFGEYMTLALAQNVVDRVGEILAAVVKNKTGISISL